MIAPNAVRGWAMTLIATWFSERGRAQHPPVPRYPLGICRWRVLGRQYGAACVLQGLVADIRAGWIDIVVIYKVGLTQSLANFARLVEIFDAHDAAFVPVRHQLNTTSEMGHLTVNRPYIIDFIAIIFHPKEARRPICVSRQHLGGEQNALPGPASGRSMDAATARSGSPKESGSWMRTTTRCQTRRRRPHPSPERRTVSWPLNAAVQSTITDRLPRLHPAEAGREPGGSLTVPPDVPARLMQPAASGGFSGGWPRAGCELAADCLQFSSRIATRRKHTICREPAAMLPYISGQPVENTNTEVSVNISRYLSISPEVVG
jgi:hypothetical protein